MFEDITFEFQEEGLKKLTFKRFHQSCEPFSDGHLSRLAQICPKLNELSISSISQLSDQGRVKMTNLIS